MAYSLPAGHVFQSRIDGLEGFSDLTTSPENIDKAVREFRSPDIESPRKATAVALGEKIKQKVAAPRETTVTVLNGNGIEGSASTANYLLSQRGYQMVLPPNGLPANAPNYAFFRTQVYFDARENGAKLAAGKLANLFGSADVKKLTPKIRALGQRRDGRHRRRPDVPRASRHGAGRPDAGAPRGGGRLRRERRTSLLRQHRREVDFPLMVPTKIERSSSIDPSSRSASTRSTRTRSTRPCA